MCIIQFVELHRLKCRVNDLAQIYDKNPKSKQNIQSLTKTKIGVTQLVTPISIDLFIVAY